MKLNYLLLLVLAAFFSGVSGQQLDTEHPPVLAKYPYFNKQFIKKQKVKTCRTEVLYKIPNRKIQPSNESMLFEFDILGRVSKVVSISNLGSDNSLSYYLNKSGKIATIHERNAYKNELKSFVYNEKGLVVSIELANGKNSKLISKNEFKYEYYSDLQYKKFCLNNEGLTYKYEVVDLDEFGRVKESRARFIRGVNREYIVNTYQGEKLVECSFNKKEVTRREEKYSMEYDHNGILQVANMSVDGAVIYRYEYLYEKNMLIAILRKEIKTQEIKITKFEYTYY
ncbi:MAG: hypothetical protein ACPGVC_01005 [Salibacteraceae bacterium]